MVPAITSSARKISPGPSTSNFPRGEVVPIPDVRETLTAGGLCDALLEGVAAAFLVDVGGLVHVERVAEVEEVRLSRGALVQPHFGPLGFEVVDVHAACSTVPC